MLPFNQKVILSHQTIYILVSWLSLGVEGIAPGLGSNSAMYNGAEEGGEEGNDEDHEGEELGNKEHIYSWMVPVWYGDGQ